MLANASIQDATTSAGLCRSAIASARIRSLRRLVGAPRLDTRFRGYDTCGMGSDRPLQWKPGPMTASTESRPRTAAPSMVAATRLGWLIVALVALALPVYASGYHLYQFSQVLIYAIALLGLNLLDRLQRPDFARSRRFLRDRRLWRGDPDHQVRLALLGGDPDRERACASSQAFCSAFPRCG